MCIAPERMLLCWFKKRRQVYGQARIKALARLFIGKANLPNALPRYDRNACASTKQCAARLAAVADHATTGKTLRGLPTPINPHPFP